jgi:hypothetical protein
MKKLVIMFAFALVFDTIAFAETDGTNYSEQVVSNQYLPSDELAVMLPLTMVYAPVYASEGTDVTYCWLTIQLLTTNGVKAVEVVAYYPLSWKVRSFQTSSDITNSNNWSGLMPEEIILIESAPYVALPRWTRWIVKRSNVGSRFFRLKTP